MVDLGTFGGGNDSYAVAVSTDGNTVVGYASNSSNQGRAFRWTSAGMVDLGTFGGGNDSYAQAVSADGNTVVGYASNSSNQSHAFRWTSAGMVDLGTVGGNTSSAQAVSADGSVVVGRADNASNQSHAFRWTSAGMVDLGTFGGNTSYALAVSADGSVVVGRADNASGQNRAFIYRGRTLLDVEAWLASVDGNSRVYHDGTTLAGLPLEGAHHRPMRSFDRMGKSSQAWATGDFGSSSRTRDVHVTTGEAGINWNVGKTGLIGFAAGHGVQNADLAYEGSSSTKGDYALVEYDYRPEGTQWIVSLLGMVGSWESEINRGYITGTGTDFSSGVADTITRSARLRVDAPTLVTYGGFGFAPFASYTMTRTIVGGYTETGGSFAASFNEQDHTAKEGRLGLTATKELSEKTKLLLTAEAIHRFDGAGPSLIGQEVVGGIAFNQPGTAPRADCVRFGFDVDHKLSADTLLNISAHASTVGEAHDVSAAISIRRAF
jgi:probable HAF family extracellular repeat protein